MTQVGHVINLPVPGRDDTGSAAPNAASARPDWTPIAQPPDPKSGVMAHTPDPSKYHMSGGRIMLPRSKRHHGSRGFSTQPGVVRIEGDPVSGEAGFQVDLSKITAENLERAISQSHEDPTLAWKLAAGGAGAAETYQPEEKSQRVAPPNQTGYLLPEGTVGGSQRVEKAASNQGGYQAAQNPSTIPAEGAPMSAPQIRDESQDFKINEPADYQQPQQSVPVPPQQYPQQPQTAQPFQPAPVQPQSQQQPMSPELNAVLSQMASSLVRLNERLEEKDEPEKEPEKESATENMTETDIDTPACSIDTGLDFLKNPPAKPTVPVVFDLGRGGKHLKRFHHATTHDVWLSLIYDSRYEGDQFIPPVTGPEEDPIEITFPDSGGKTVRAMVPESANMSIGCLDIINFILVDTEKPQQERPPSPAEFLQE